MIDEWLRGVHAEYAGGSTRGSGEDIVEVLNLIDGFYISRRRRKNKKTEGAWVPYFQTFSSDPVLVGAMEEVGVYGYAKPIKHCFIHALEVSGIEYKVTCELFGYLARKDLKKISQLLDINIICKTRRNDRSRCRTIKSYKEANIKDCSYR